MNVLSSTPPEIFRRWLTISLLFVFVLMGAIHGFSHNNKLVLLGLAYTPIAVLLINKLNLWFILSVGLFYSWIYIPGFPPALSLFHLMIIGMIPVLIATRCLKAPILRNSGILKFYTYGYLLVILLTIYFRGFGLRFFGGETWGGAPYIHLIIMIPFFLLSESIQLSSKEWKIAIVIFFLAGLIPSLAEIVFLLSKGTVTFLYCFIKPEGTSALSNLAIIQKGEGVLRFQVSKYISMLFVLCLALFPYKGKYKIPIILSCFLGFGFAGLSGHRSTVIYLLLLIPLIMFFSTRKVPVRLLIVYVVTLAFSVSFIYIFSIHLPLSIQRAFSWLPGINISWDARASAVGTLTWRFEVWRRIISLLPQYWLLGRGFAFNVNDYYSLRYSMHANIDWAIITHNYHNGPLSLLADLGVFGLFFGSGIMIAGVIRHCKLLKRLWLDANLERYHMVLLASFSVDVFRFYLIHGDAVNSIIAFLMQLAMLEGIYRTDLFMTIQSTAKNSEF